MVDVRISNILFTYIDGTWASGPGHVMCAKYLAQLLILIFAIVVKFTTVVNLYHGC